MVLSKCGEEFELYATKIAGKWKGRIFIFGAGIRGKELYRELSAYPAQIEMKFIDNDAGKIGTVYEDAEIISLAEYLQLNEADRGIIVIAIAQADAVAAVEEQLANYGLQHREYYFTDTEFQNEVFPIISLYCYDKSYVSLAQISLTERCTLKCKKCAHACYAVDIASDDMPLEEAYRSADCFFSKVDFISEFVLIGGEPLLYKELSKVITYIGDKYRKQIGLFTITTNGTIIPSKEVIRACSKANVMFRISNYSKAIPRLKISLDRLTTYLSKYGILYVLGKPDGEWKDYGFEYVNRKASSGELITVFDQCKTPCREMRGNRFYFCVMARTVSDNLRYHVGEDDYLDFDKLNGTEYKKELLKFNLGYSEKGYLDMCNFCHGAESINYPIPVAEQII